jgi:hypothetical protein
MNLAMTLDIPTKPRALARMQESARKELCMSDKVVPAVSVRDTRRTFWSSRALKLACVSLFLGLAACSADVGSSDNLEDETEGTLQSVDRNLCVGQAANTFQCLDDTRFEHCTGNDGFVVNSCPPGLCATRTPSNQNPCVGRDVAARVDGVEPPQAGQATPPAADQGNAGNAGDNGGACGADGAPGPKFDPSGTKNIGNGRGIQFIGGQCLSQADCASGCCALPCGICSGPGAQFQAGNQGCGFVDDNIGAPPAVVTPPPPPPPPAGACNANGSPGPIFDVSGAKNVGNGQGIQFIGGQCLSQADCASGCCALPCGICSGPGAQFLAGKQGCGFGN